MRWFAVPVMCTIVLAFANAPAQGAGSPCGEFLRWEAPIAEIGGRGLADAGSCIVVVDPEDGTTLVDVSDPFNPVICATLPEAPGEWVTVAGNLAVVSRPRLSIIDIADPYDPILLSSVYTASPPTDVAVIGEYAYVCVSELGQIGGAPPYGVQRFDISDPTAPVSLGLMTDYWATSVEGDGQYLYVGRGYGGAEPFIGIEVYDTSAIPNPALVGAVSGFSAFEILIDNGTLYAGDTWSSFPEALVTVDVRDPANPRLVDVQPREPYGGVFPFKFGDHLVLTGSNYFEFFSIEDPLHPQFEFRSYTVASTWPGVVRGTTVYSQGLLVYDFSALRVPESLVVAPENGARPVGMEVVGHHAFIAENPTGLRVFDVSDPTSAFQVGEFPLPDEVNYFVVDGVRGYAATSDAGITIVDLGDPGVPVVLGVAPAPTDAAGLAVSGDHLLVASPTEGLVIVDVADPLATSVTSTLPLAGQARRVDEQSGLAFVATSDGVEIVDVSNVAAPVPRGTYPMSSPNNLIVSGYVAYVASYSALHVVDVEDPDLPVQLAVLDIWPRSTPDLVLDAGHLFVGTQWGLMVIDVRDPERPRVVTQGVEPDFVSGIARVDDFALTVEQYGELSVTSLACDGAVPVTLQSFDARVEGRSAVVEWSSVIDDASAFRLQASHESESRDLPIQQLGVGRFAATAELGAWVGRVEFVLATRGVDGWRIVGETSIVIPSATDTSITSVVPNPFNPATTIEFALQQAGHIVVSIHDLRGRRVRVITSGQYDAGRHAVEWDGRDSQGRPVASGAYVVRLEGDGRIDARKVVLLK